ncbi:hypothetical protein [Vibrio sp. 10N.261.51.F12]|uniref:hypothetical protein n=1 Tax=Vibrio sp. 10N.261.51.F12 TaxID=3229679 RepID=UPI00354E4FBD
MMRAFIIGMSLLSLAGCVAYPTQRTYFKPIKDNHELVKSRSCGYHKTELDGLSAYTARYRLQVFPNTPTAQNLVVVVTLESKDLAPASSEWQHLGQVQLSTPNAPTPQSPTSFKITQRYQQTLWYRIEFDTMPTKQFSLDINVEKSKPLRFNFHFANESDFYYASINC